MSFVGISDDNVLKIMKWTCSIDESVLRVFWTHLKP